jgi:transcriptional regulator with XRE-family HTH domain
MDFADWLRKELDLRKWSYAELARRSSVKTAQISRVANGSLGAGPDLCIAIAKGLNFPREEVFRARGWLLSEPENPFGPEIDVRTEQLAKSVSALPFNIREAACYGTCTDLSDQSIQTSPRDLIP